MIDAALSCGCLLETVKAVREQETGKYKYFRWVIQGWGKSYKDFWRE